MVWVVVVRVEGWWFASGVWMLIAALGWRLDKAVATSVAVSHA